MSKQIAKLLKADDMSGLAQVIRSKGRGRDTVLAHITPQEAALLKRRGGRGSINPNTGLPEFEDGGGDIGGGFDVPMESPVTTPPEQMAGAMQPITIDPTYQSYFGPQGVQTAAVTPAAQDWMTTTAAAPIPPAIPAALTPTAAAGEMAAAGAEQKPSSEKSWWDKISPETLTRLGLSGGLGLLGATQARKAAGQAQAAAGEQKAIAQPYQQQGQALQRAAAAGELTPASLQSYKAMQAQLAQGVESRGGVGAAQAAGQLEAFRQNLLNNQYNYGLQVSQIGDQIALGAIRTGLQLDQQVNQANNAFYTSLAYIAAGLPTRTI